MKLSAKISVVLASIILSATVFPTLQALAVTNSNNEVVTTSSVADETADNLQFGVGQTVAVESVPMDVLMNQMQLTEAQTNDKNISKAG